MSLLFFHEHSRVRYGFPETVAGYFVEDGFPVPRFFRTFGMTCGPGNPAPTILLSFICQNDKGMKLSHAANIFAVQRLVWGCAAAVTSLNKLAATFGLAGNSLPEA